jgi:Tfp pilus assembly protein PilZ
MLFKGDTAREYHTETVSEGGAYIKADDPLPVGTEVGISIRHKNGTLELSGRVIYIKGTFEAKSGIPTGMAVEFSDVSPRDTLILNRLVTELIAADVAEADGRPVMTMPWQSGSSGRISAEDQS